MSDHRESIKYQFDEISGAYDQQRRKLIPCFDDFYGVAASLAEMDHASPRVLDLGAGTGLMSSFILNKYPKAHLTLVDLSEGMLDIAKTRFRGQTNIRYIAADYSKMSFDESYDMVVSSLSIHHLDDTEKKTLYKTIYTTLNSGGLFINADQVLGSTPFLESLYKSDWKTKIQATDLTAAELQSAYERTKLDKMSTLDEQLYWLKEIGFTDADCVFKSYNFVVMFARKSS